MLSVDVIEMNYIVVYVLVDSYFHHGAAALIAQNAHHDCVIAIVIVDCMQAAPSDPVSEAR